MKNFSWARGRVVGPDTSAESPHAEELPAPEVQLPPDEPTAPMEPALEDLRAIDNATADLAPLLACAEAVGGVDALVTLVRPGAPRCAACPLAAVDGLRWCRACALVAQLSEVLR